MGIEKEEAESGYDHIARRNGEVLERRMNQLDRRARGQPTSEDLDGLGFRIDCHDPEPLIQKVKNTVPDATSELHSQPAGPKVWIQLQKDRMEGLIERRLVIGAPIYSFRNCRIASSFFGPIPFTARSSSID